MNRRSMVGLLSTLLLLGCGSGAGQKGTTKEADLAAIQELHDEWAAAMDAGEAARAAAVFAEDGVEMPPGPAQIGRGAVQARYQSVFDRFTGEFSSSVETIVVDQDLAYLQGTVTAVWTPVGEGEPLQEYSKNIFVFSRQPDGTWKVVRNIWNRSPAPGSQ